jgi:transcriptional regulator with XRE-family HTH domain
MPTTPPRPTLKVAYQIAILVKSLRTFFRLSQTDLAKLSRVSRPTLDRIESLRGIERARQDTLEQLLDAFRDLGVSITVDPEQGAQVSYSLAAMTLSVETLTKDTDLPEQLSLFERPSQETPSDFDRLLALTATQRSQLMERYRGQPFPSPKDPVWQQAQREVHAVQAQALTDTSQTALSPPGEADEWRTGEDLPKTPQDADIIGKEEFERLRQATAKKRPGRTTGGKGPKKE